MPSRSESMRGFTLVEVMIALLIVALTLPGLLFMLDQQVDGTAYLRDRSLARVVASNRLSELQLALATGSRNLSGRIAGRAELAERDWFWSMQSQTTELPGFSRVVIEVRREESQATQALYTITALLPLPDEGGNG